MASGTSTQGGNLTIAAVETGGDGGFGQDGANGGNGASVTGSNIVSGVTNGGLALTQSITAGAGGGVGDLNLTATSDGKVGTAGDAVSYLNVVNGGTGPLSGDSTATGGVGGGIYDSIGTTAGSGGTATNTLSLSSTAAAVQVAAVGIANGGVGGVVTNSGTGNGGSGGMGTSSTSITASGAGTGLNIQDEANGGAGGGVSTSYSNTVSTGNGGVGGAASSTASGQIAGSTYTFYTGGFNPGVLADATGGAGGQGQGPGFKGGVGGAATALATGTSTGAGTLIVGAVATGGSGGSGGDQAAGNHGGAATATSLGISAGGVVQASATATGGAATSGSAGGGAALAHATAEGEIGWASFSASSSGGLVDSVIATGSAPTVGNAATAGEGGAVVLSAAPADSAFASFQSGAYGTGLPTNLTSVIAGATNVEGVFNNGGTTDLGVVDLEDKANTSGREFDANVAFTLNTTTLTGDHLKVGFIQGSDIVGSGTTGVVLTITVGTTETVETFTSLASAETFFDDNVIDLGSLVGSSDLSVDFDLELSSSGVGNEFDSELTFGAEVPEPATWGMLIVGMGAVAIMGRRIKRDKRPG